MKSVSWRNNGLNLWLTKQSRQECNAFGEAIWKWDYRWRRKPEEFLGLWSGWRVIAEFD